MTLPLRARAALALPLVAGVLASQQLTASAAEAPQSSATWTASSRTAKVSLQTRDLAQSDVGTTAAIRINAPAGGAIDCTKLELDLIAQDGTRTKHERNWKLSGCYTGAVELHATLSATAAGKVLALTAPVTAPAGVTSFAAKGFTRTAGVTTQASVQVKQATSTPAPVATAAPTTAKPTTSATPTPAPAPTGTAKPEAVAGSTTDSDSLPAALQGSPVFHVNPWNQIGTAYRNETDPEKKKLYGAIANTASASWYDGVNSKITHTKDLLASAKAKGTVPTIVIYGLPGRDCGLYSAGGQANATSYKAWIDQMSAAVGTQKTVVIVEPDAISFCGGSAGFTTAQKAAIRAERTELMTYVGKTFQAKNPNAALYIHAGSAQLQQDPAADAVIDSGIKYMRGFAMNVAGLSSTERNEAWAEQFVKTLAAKGVANKHYVVDTARSGLDHPANPGATYNSCNNFNAVPGPVPSTRTVGAHADAYLWIKGASGSDGAGCHEAIGKVAPTAGLFYPELVQAVVRNGVKAGVLTLN